MSVGKIPSKLTASLPGLTASIAELNYCAGVTAAIQAQIDAKAPIASPTFTTKITTPIIDLTSGQIAFPATQNPSADVNTLDDYEEGAWTVQMTASTSGTIALYSTMDVAAYTKIGNIVHVHGTIRIQTLSSPVGNVQISLPFTIFNMGESAGNSTGSIGTWGVSMGGDYLTICGEEGLAYFKIFRISTNAAWQYMVCTALANGDYFIFAFTYRTA